MKIIMKAKLNKFGELDKLKVRAVVRGDIQKKLAPLPDTETWVATASFRALRYFVSDAVKHGRPIRQMKGNRVFIKFISE